MSQSYKNIFKTTFLLGFVQIFNILVKVITNKIVSVLLGAEGMGTIGIYNNTIDLLKKPLAMSSIPTAKGFIYNMGLLSIFAYSHSIVALGFGLKS